MKTCNKCKAIYPDSDRICPSCGHDNSVVIENNIPQTNTGNNNKKPYIISIILILLGVFTLPIGIIFLIIGAIMLFANLAANTELNKIETPTISSINTTGLTREQLLSKKNQYSPTSREYATWENAYNETFIEKTLHYSKQNEITYQFDLTYLQFYRSYGKDNLYTDLYYIPKKYYEKVNSYLININLIIKKFTDTHKLFSIMTYNIEKLSFLRSNNPIDDFCVFRHHPLTKTGKIAKYPYSLSLRFGSGDHSCLDVYFDKLGNFIKGEFCCWQNKKC